MVEREESGSGVAKVSERAIRRKFGTRKTQTAGWDTHALPCFADRSFMD